MESPAEESGLSMESPAEESGLEMESSAEESARDAEAPLDDSELPESAGKSPKIALIFFLCNIM